MEVIRFPNVVGLDVERAKVSIRTKLCGKYAFFTMKPWTRNRKREEVAQRDNEIILYIDDKFQCVAKTPEWRRGGHVVEDDDIVYNSNDEDS